jgi:hypothetical protein
LTRERYLAEERRGALLFLAAGLAALTLSLGLALSRTAYRGMVPPLGAFGLVEVAAGSFVLLRTARGGEDLEKERTRLRRVIASFRIYKVAETVVLTAGLTLMMLFPRHTVLYASGLGCLVQASVLLVLDRVAERRARAYAAALDATSSPRPAPDRA